MAIKIGPATVFRCIPFEMLIAMYELLYAGELQNIEPVITGAADEHYPVGKVHDRGYAIDVRTSNLPDPQKFADQLSDRLGVVDPHFKVLYGDPAHLDHIHIGYSWWYSRDEVRRRRNGKR